MKKLLSIICISILLSSCRNAPPSSAKDEISLYEWQFTDLSGNVHGSLSFNNGKIKISDDIINFSDDCIISEKNITVNSKNYGVIILDYSMSGDTLELEYLGKKISLKKK